METRKFELSDDIDSDLLDEQTSQIVDLLRLIEPYFDRDAAIDDITYGNIHVVEDKDEILASSIFHVQDESRTETGQSEGWVSYLAVSPEHQRQGVGSELIDYFSAMCLARGVGSLNSIPTGEIAPKFFREHNGFSEFEHPVFGTIMRKTIT